MPVPLLKHHFCRRSHGRPKAHAHAAYLSGTKLDDGFGHTADFTPKGGILLAEVWTPENAPVWAKDRGRLWKEVEKREDKTTRKADAILAHKFIGALPHELSFEENVCLVKDFIREQFTRRGYAADWAIHAADPGGDARNLHVHIMVPLRRFEKGEWAKTKDRFPKNGPSLSDYIKGKQSSFFELQNRYLAKNGLDAQIVRKDGKWTVVGHIGSTYARIRRENYLPAHAKVPTLPTPSVPKTSHATPIPGGSNIMSPARRAMARAAMAMTTEMKPGAASHAPLIQPNKRGWPEKAIWDWEDWGHRNPPGFFKLWPELSGGGSSPSAGGP